MAFFFTFFDFKCGGQKILSVSGKDLVIGTEFQKPDFGMGSSKQIEKIEPNIFAILSFITAVIGIIIFFVKSKKENLTWIILSICGLVSLLIVYLGAQEKASGNSAQQVIEVSPQIGYYLAILGFIVAGVISYVLFNNEKNKH